MARKIIQRYLPHPDSVKKNKYLKPFGSRLHDPQLWHLTRSSVSRAFAIGLFCAFIPVPFQMILAALAAIIFRAHILISLALIWITNPLTIPFLFGSAYYIGLLTLGMRETTQQFEFSFSWFSNMDFLLPFLWGCFLCSTVLAIVGYFFIQLFWRVNVLIAWKKRKRTRAVNKNTAGA